MNAQRSFHIAEDLAESDAVLCQDSLDAEVLLRLR